MQQVRYLTRCSLVYLSCTSMIDDLPPGAPMSAAVSHLPVKSQSRCSRLTEETAVQRVSRQHKSWPLAEVAAGSMQVVQLAQSLQGIHHVYLLAPATVAQQGQEAQP